MGSFGDKDLGSFGSISMIAMPKLEYNGTEFPNPKWTSKPFAVRGRGFPAQRGNIHQQATLYQGSPPERCT
jgi:hypothetical protein